MARFPDAVIDLFDAHFGCAARPALVAIVGAGTVDGWHRRDVIVTVERGVYRPAGGGQPPEQPAMAALLRARNLGAVTGPFVLGLLGVDGFSPRDPFELLLRGRRSLTHVGFPWRIDPLPSMPVAAHGPLTIVPPSRAVVDTGRWLETIGARRLRLAYDAARWRNLTDVRRTTRVMELLGDMDAGVQALREVIGDDLVAESQGERCIGPALDHGQIAYERQVWVLPDVRVDILIREPRLVLEYFGSVDHATAVARLADDERSSRLSAAGYAMIPVVEADLRDLDSFVRWVRWLMNRGPGAIALG